MAAEVVRMSAASFRMFRQENWVERYDHGKRIVWFAEEDGRVRCVDRASLWNAGAGGSDDELLVVADSEAEAAQELERVRPR